jgi:hypothetical protein
MIADPLAQAARAHMPPITSPQLEKALDIDCLMKWIDGMSLQNPADRAEFDALIGIFRENNGKIKTLYAEQMETIEELIALSHDAPQGA